MSDKIIDLNNTATRNALKASGFVLWEGETWKPEGQVVDWSSDYDKELQRFAESCVKLTLRVIAIDVGALSAEEHAAVLLGIQQRFGSKE